MERVFLWGCGLIFASIVVVSVSFAVATLRVLVRALID
jgi:hypothetical protein